MRAGNETDGDVDDDDVDDVEVEDGGSPSEAARTAWISDDVDDDVAGSVASRTTT